MNCVKTLLAILIFYPFFSYGISITNDAFWTEINYGWVCPVDMTLTANTIFKADPEKAIYKEDIIQLLLGLHERGLATQKGSNSYYVTPYSQTETFTERVYSTNSTVTNLIIKTNAIGYLLNFRPFLRESYHPWAYGSQFGNALGGVIPYFFNASNVYNGTTNLPFYSREGLMVQLQVGGTQQVDSDGNNPYNFIAVPGSTNTFTNYPVCYTQDVSSLTYTGNTSSNYYIGNTSYFFFTGLYTTNYLTSTQSYLAPYSQTVNYATSVGGVESYVLTSYWYTATQYMHWTASRLIYNYTDNSFGTSQVYVKTNSPHYLREAGYWFHFPGGFSWTFQGVTYLYNYSRSDPYYLWLELGGGTEFEKYNFATCFGWWGEEEGFVGLRRPQVYRVILMERYKMLNALQHTAPTYSYTGFSRTVSMSSNNTDAAGLAALKTLAEAAFTNALVADTQTPYAYAQVARSGTAPTNLNWTVTLKRSYGIWKTGYVNTNVAHEKPQAYVRGRVSSALWAFDNQGDTVNSTSSYALSAESVEADVRTNYTIIVGSSALPSPTVWPDTPTNNATWTKGYLTDATDRKVVIPWNFLYCTNKYW